MDVPAFPPAHLAGRRRFHRDLRALLDGLGIDSSITYVPPIVCSASDETSLPSDADPIRTSVGQIQVFIDEHAGEALSLDRLADRAHLSKYHFARVFQEATGRSPWSYVVEARIRRAKVLLRDDDLPLSQIALEAGFCDQSHLTNAFKKAEGKTPGQYRQERKNLQEER